MQCSWGWFAGLVAEPLPMEGWGLQERNRKCRSHRLSHPGSWQVTGMTEIVFVFPLSYFCSSSEELTWNNLSWGEEKISVNIPMHVLTVY